MCAPMIAATAFVLQSVLAQLTREQCAAVAAVNGVQLSVEPAHYCGCNFKDAASPLEYTPAGAVCTETRAEYTNDPHTVTENTKFNGTAASTFLVAGGTRGCFLKCAYDSSCTAASAKNNQFEDTECFLFDSVSSTISEEGTTSVLFTKGSAAVAPLDSSSTMCPSNRPIASSDRTMCLPSATTCSATETGLQFRSPPSGGLRIGNNYAPLPGYNTAGLTRGEWWYDPFIATTTTGYLYKNGTGFQQPTKPAYFQITASTTFYLNNTIQARNCTTVSASFYAPQMCSISSTPPTVVNATSACECEQAAVSDANVKAWDFRKMINKTIANRCRLFTDGPCVADSSTTSESNEPECKNRTTHNCVSSFYPQQATIDGVHIFDPQTTSNENAVGDGYQLGDVLEFKRGDSKYRATALAMEVTQKMFFERGDPVNCADADCALITDPSQCRCKCGPAVQCASSLCFDYDPAGFPGSTDDCIAMTGQFLSSTGGTLIKIEIRSAVKLSVVLEPTTYVAHCRHRSIQFELEDGPAIITAADASDGPPGSIALSVADGVKMAAIWVPFIVAPPPPPPDHVPPVPPPPSPTLTRTEKDGIGAGIAVIIVIALVSFFVYRECRKQHTGKKEPLRQKLLM